MRTSRPTLRTPRRKSPRSLGDGTVSYSDGQIDNFEITMRPVRLHSDAYDADHYSFYEDLPGYV